MYKASQPNSSSQVQEWISIFDYVGYVLFFNALFFVLHALSIIVWSIRTSFSYGIFHDTSLADVTHLIDQLKEQTFLRYLYESNYNPFLPLPRQIAEFKVIHILFRDAFGIPNDFSFGAYLGKCFERYSLRIIHLSLTSWIVMILLFGCNLIRIFTPSQNGTFNCDHFTHDERSGDDGHSATELKEESDTFFSSSTTSSSSTSSSVPSNCEKSYVTLFCGCALALLLYVFVIFFLGRVYTLRLLAKAGVEGIQGIDDDLTYFLTEEATRELNLKSVRPDLGDDIILLHKRKNRSQSRRMSLTTFTKKIGKSLHSSPLSVSFSLHLSSLSVPRSPIRIGQIELHWCSSLHT
jgi:hypothetical protein